MWRKKSDLVIWRGFTTSYLSRFSFFIMLTGKTSVLIDTQKSDEDAPAVADDTNQTIDSSVMDDQTDDGENEADDNCKNKRDRPKQGGVMKAVDRSKFGKFIIHYGKTYFFFFQYPIVKTNVTRIERKILCFKGINLSFFKCICLCAETINCLSKGYWGFHYLFLPHILSFQIASIPYLHFMICSKQTWL